MGAPISILRRNLSERRCYIQVLRILLLVFEGWRERYLVKTIEGWDEASQQNRIRGDILEVSKLSPVILWGYGKPSAFHKGQVQLVSDFLDPKAQLTCQLV